MVKNKNTLVVNLYGGPGSGKSKIAATIFSKLKWRGSVKLIIKHILEKLKEIK